MPLVTKYLVLCREDSLNRSHQGSSFPCQVTKNFLPEISFEQVSASYGDAQGYHSFFCSAARILKNSIAAIQSTSLQKHSP